MPQISFSDLGELTGALGIGSIAVLAVLMVLDTLSPIHTLIETEADSQTWALFVAVPIIVISYVAGIICVALGNTARTTFSSVSPPEPEWVSIPESLLNIVTVQYRNAKRKIDVLDGATVAFLMLAIGLALEGFHFGLPALGAMLATISVATSTLCFFIAGRTEIGLINFVRGTMKS
ncbi:MAG: hypothetical protein AAFO97_09665 [Pseudomonadota bacterium]